MKIVSREMLETLAASASKEPEQNRPASGWRDWLLEHGQEIKSEGPYGDGYRYVVKQCPFHPAH